MKLDRVPELKAFFATYFPDSDPDADEQVARAFVSASSQDRQDKVIAQARQLLADAEFPLEDLGTEANRWFGDADEARAWLGRILHVLEGAQSSEGPVVKDSNGAVLSEGDSVLVIKDLKVKGGSSDLKRGTMIKKIHLIDDPEAIECRVDGSTLVLKTCFLKKA
jgi:protein PhnA